ncbi:hypothetical protein ZWY2020_019737 [Hordeum vulgare]|nr:hypothetical protein ZWY2020_019737 [Hordeum vulgare]
MAVRQPRLSEQRAWPQARALLRRTALSVLSTRRDQELVRAGDAHEALDSEDWEGISEPAAQPTACGRENSSARFQLDPSRLAWESGKRRHQHPLSHRRCHHHRPSAPVLWPFPSIASALHASAGYWIRSSARLQQASKHSKFSLLCFPSLI